MTKLRDPVTIENTLLLVVARLTPERAAEVTNREASYLRALHDPDRREHLTVRDLELLDLEHHTQFGEGFPLYEALGRRLESTAAERFADQAAIGRATMAVAKECGEAMAAMIAAGLPGADRRMIEEGLRQLEEADAATDAAIAVFRCALARDGPPPPPT